MSPDFSTFSYAMCMTFMLHYLLSLSTNILSSIYRFFASHILDTNDLWFS